MKVKIVKPDAKRILKSTDGMQIVGVYRASDTAEIDLDIKDPCEGCARKSLGLYDRNNTCFHIYACNTISYYQGQKSILDKLEV